MANESLLRNQEIVDGNYSLGAVIRRSVRSTVYQTLFGEPALPAVIRIRDRESEDAEEVVERWRNSVELAHPNLLKVYAAGTAVLNGAPIIYVVMERADESLAGVLAGRALTEAETREMLAPTLAALRFLHENGFAHTRLSASNVMAVGNELKLSSENATRLTDGGSPAEDMTALGILIIQALTQKRPGGNNGSEAYGFLEIPQPFSDIARHCLDPDPATRWTLDQLEARLKGPVGEPVVLISAPPVERRPAAAPAYQARAEEDEADGARDRNRSHRGAPNWVYAGLALVLVVVGLLASLRKKNPVPAPQPVTAVTVHAPPAVTVPPAPPARTITPFPVAGSPSSGGHTPPPPAAGGRKAEGWAVIVAAYGSRQSAEKRMRQLAGKWPRFHLSVAQPASEKARYLVVLGENLPEDRAEALRRQAVQAGLPRDTYIKRLM